MHIEEIQTKLNCLINDQRALHLASIDAEGNPHASTTPYITLNGKIYIFISELTQHCKNLMSASKLSVLLVEDESKTDQIFARNRVSWSVSYLRIERDSDHFDQIISKMNTRLGSTVEMLKNLKDFHLYELTPKNGRLILGFGKAFNMNGMIIESQPISGK